jgi:FAD synthetase
MTKDPQPTAGVVVIGDEVLSGKVEEKNAVFMIRRFRVLGIRLARVVIVPDAMEDIGEVVRHASETYDLVCTTGGVGPTHDDITIEAIARAFEVPVVSHPKLEALVREYFGEEATAAQLRLALVPEGTVLDGEDSPPWPTAHFRNIHIFPGIPRLMASKFDAIAHTFGGAPMYAGSLEIAAAEWEICDALDGVVQSHPHVSIGSYPRREQGSWRVRVTVDATGREDAEAAFSALERALSSHLTSTDPVAVVS